MGDCLGQECGRCLQNLLTASVHTATPPDTCEGAWGCVNRCRALYHHEPGNGVHNAVLHIIRLPNCMPGYGIGIASTDHEYTVAANTISTSLSLSVWPGGLRCPSPPFGFVLLCPSFLPLGLLQLVSPAVAVDHPGVSQHAVEALAALAQDSRSMKGLVSNMLYI